MLSVSVKGKKLRVPNDTIQIKISRVSVNSKLIVKTRQARLLKFVHCVVLPGFFTTHLLLSPPR